MLNIAFYQQDILWCAPEANRLRARKALERIGNNADILVLPETFTTGFGEIMTELAEPINGSTWQFLHLLAIEHDALVVGTWPVIDINTSGEKAIYNRLHWVTPNGNGGYYDKGHTFRMSSEVQQIERGSVVTTFEWRGWRIRPAVCYDLRFPKWLRNKIIDNSSNTLVKPLPGLKPGQRLDYDLLLVCANWPATRRQAWDTLLQARAIENLAYVVGVNRVGQDGACIKYSGGSAAYDYCGRTLVQAQDGLDEVCMVTLNEESLHHFRAQSPIYLDFD